MAVSRDDHGIVGLNAMIMFIAMTLAGSIIATIIITSMAEVMRESKADANRTQFALYGKVMVVDAHITQLEKNGDEIEEALLSLTIELSPVQLHCKINSYFGQLYVRMRIIQILQGGLIMEILNLSRR